MPRLGPVARGRSELKTHGVIDFDKGAIDVKLAAEIHGLGHDVLSVEHATVNAHVRGTLRAPQIDVTVHGDVLDFGGYRFSRARIEVHGPASGATVQVSLDADGDGAPDFEAEGQLSIGSTTKIDQIKVHVARARENVHVHVGEIQISHGEISVDPIEIEGLGGPVHASFHSTLRARARPGAGDGDRPRPVRARLARARGGHRLHRVERRGPDGAPRRRGRAPRRRARRSARSAN